MAREVVTPVEHGDLERRLGGEILPNEPVDTVDHVRVLEDVHLGVEDARLFLAGVIGGAPAHVFQALARATECGGEALDLGGDLIIRHDALRHLRHLPVQHVHRAGDDAGGGGDSGEALIHYRSPNFAATRSAMAFTACSASGPLARTRSVEPNSAASIITPMMLLPFTSRSSRTIVISAWNLDESFTISAAGLACSPFLFTISTVRSIIM